MTDRSREKGDAGEHGTGAVHGLRRRAEEEVRKVWTDDPQRLSGQEAQRLLHELRVHQIELELQNEELRRAQVALDASRARYFDLYDLAPVGYVTISEQGLILEANLRASTMLGTHRGTLVKQPLTRFIVAEDQDTYYQHRKELFKTGEPQMCELRMKQPDGTRLWARLEATAAQDEESGALTCRATISDITEARTLQASLAQADRMASMGLLAAGVAHEINNPLTSVLYNTESLAEDLPLLAGAVGRCREALRERVGSEALAEIAGKGARMFDPSALAELSDRAKDAAAGAQRITEIAKGLGSYSRVEHGDLSMVDLNRSAELAINMASNEIKYRAMTVKNLGRVPKILGSGGKLAQVLLNLIVNAAHSIDEGAPGDNRITVRTWAETDHVFAEVTDTGCGIARQDLDNIFQPFFTTKAPDRGTGLGLAITRRIVSEFGGDIRVESTIGEGTRFVVQFPIGRAEAEASSPMTAETSGVRGRILVVDDEKSVRTTIANILGQEREVVSAGSGREAKELLRTDTRFDLILCDLMMPDVSGIDLHAWLAKHQPLLARRLVFITGGVFTPQTDEYLGRVANIRVQKPFDRASLKKLVGELVVAAQSEK